jgi:hypothetical protein
MLSATEKRSNPMTPETRHRQSQKRGDRSQKPAAASQNSSIQEGRCNFQNHTNKAVRLLKTKELTFWHPAKAVRYLKTRGLEI